MRFGILKVSKISSMCPDCKKEMHPIGRMTLNPNYYKGKSKWKIFGCRKCNYREGIPE